MVLGTAPVVLRGSDVGASVLDVSWVSCGLDADASRLEVQCGSDDGTSGLVCSVCSAALTMIRLSSNSFVL